MYWVHVSYFCGLWGGAKVRPKVKGKNRASKQGGDSLDGEHSSNDDDDDDDG